MIIEEGSRQVGVKDCGIFAVATATLLANGDNPSTFTFDQHSLYDRTFTQVFENIKLRPSLRVGSHVCSFKYDMLPIHSYFIVLHAPDMYAIP